ncbi:MAG: hypothetical protein K6T77_04040, partial [candidate division WOR-3 bacterium]|nr:hypothetical protein [candidate division WOR-3 bacterium]
MFSKPIAGFYVAEQDGLEKITILIIAAFPIASFTTSVTNSAKIFQFKLKWIYNFIVTGGICKKHKENGVMKISVKSFNSG